MSPWVGSVFAAYGDNKSDKPGNSIPVINNSDGDINAGHKGKFVWIVAQYHNNWSTALSDIRAVVSDTERAGESDLAKGAGGKYRYLEFKKGGDTRVAELTLLRRKEKVTWEQVQGLGFNGWTGDINAGRGGDYVHLVWKNERQ